VRRIERQAEYETCSRELAFLDTQSARVGLDDSTTEREPDAETAHPVGGDAAHVGREESLAIRRRDPRSVVLDRDLDGANAFELDVDGLDPDHAGRPAMTDRVGQQIRDDLLDPTRVEREHGIARAQAHLHLDPALFEARHQRSEGRFEYVVQIRWRRRDGKRSRRVGARFEQVFHEGVEPRTGFETLLDEVLLLRVERAMHLVGEQPSEPAQDGDRRAQLVADEMDQLRALTGLLREPGLELGDARPRALETHDAGVRRGRFGPVRRGVRGAGHAVPIARRSRRVGAGGWAVEASWTEW